MHTKFIVIAIALLLAAPVAAQTADYRRPVLRELEDYASRNAEYSVTYTGSGRTSTATPLELAIYVTAGRSYLLRGSCDEDCRDVDLSVKSANGTTLGSDMLTDDFPIVSFVAPYTGSVVARVTMPSCSTSWCYYGLIVLEK